MSETVDGETIKQLWKSYNTVLEILHDRKYVIEPNAKLNYEQFLDKKVQDNLSNISDIRKAMEMTYDLKINNVKDPIICFWTETANLDDVKYVKKIMDDRKIRKSILVVNKTSHSSFKNVKSDLLKNISLFTIENTQFNISKHRLVPKHIICSKNEKNEVVKHYTTKLKNLPFIKSSDQMVNYLGAKKGDLIKIIRISETYNFEMLRFPNKEIDEDKKIYPSIYYRLVV